MKISLLNKKKNLIAIILLLIAGFIVGGYLVLESRSSKALSMKELTENLAQNNFINDKDYDGLEDWEEEIYKTDPNNPDTDGDGYLDGEEVAAGYDPNIPAPNDKMPENRFEGDRPNPGNLTEMFYYLMVDKFKKNEFDLSSIDTLSAAEEINIDQRTQESLKKATAGFMANFVPPFQKENHVFETIKQNNSITTEKYKNDFVKVMAKVTSCNNGIISQDGLKNIEQGSKIENVEQLIKMSECYFKNQQDLLEINPPLNWLDIHKQLLFILWQTAQVAKRLPEVQNDPLKGVIVISQFKQVLENLPEIQKQVKLELNKK